MTGCDRVRPGRGGKEGSMVGQEQVAGEPRAIGQTLEVGTREVWLGQPITEGGRAEMRKELGAEVSRGKGC